LGEDPPVEGGVVGGNVLAWTKCWPVVRLIQPGTLSRSQKQVTLRWVNLPLVDG
jgi:hypothetical protein